MRNKKEEREGERALIEIKKQIILRKYEEYVEVIVKKELERLIH